MKIWIIAAILCASISGTRALGADCRFGQEISSLTEEPSLIFEVHYLGKFVKIARAEIEGTAVRVRVYEVVERATAKVFHLNYTDEDEFDGGNSIGWIEYVKSLEIVARIQDSQFYECH
jgi:hypothetical protein